MNRQRGFTEFQVIWIIDPAQDHPKGMHRQFHVCAFVILSDQYYTNDNYPTAGYTAYDGLYRFSYGQTFTPVMQFLACNLFNGLNKNKQKLQVVEK